MTCGSVLLVLACAARAQVLTPHVTAAAAGPYRVVESRIVDSNGRDYLIRGTRLLPITLQETGVYGAFSATTLITVRQRLNMNAVRLVVDGKEYESNAAYRSLVKRVVHDANQFELLTILETDPPADLVKAFRENPNVFFALTPGDVKHADVKHADVKRGLAVIRSGGARQPIIVPSGVSVDDPNIVYEVSATYGTEIDYSRQVPLIVNGLDPEIGKNGAQCASFPRDPADASKRLEDLLTSFDRHAVSWTISSLEPGKILDNYRGYDWTRLDSGWTCGQFSLSAGIGMALLAHLWSADPHGLLTVNQPAGGFVIARGANASTYGRTLAGREALAKGFPLPLKLADISIRVTDSRGISRLAPLAWTGAGWSSANLVIPPDCAPGPAEVSILRDDGSTTSSGIVIADVAPGLFTATYDGRGPVIGYVSQRFPDGRIKKFEAWSCGKDRGYARDGCSTVAIPLAARVRTLVRIDGTGFRFAKNIRAMVDGVSVPVRSFGVIGESTRDQVTVELPDDLAGRGEVDLFLIADGALSNVVRIGCGK